MAVTESVDPDPARPLGDTHLIVSAPDESGSRRRAPGTRSGRRNEWSAKILADAQSEAESRRQRATAARALAEAHAAIEPGIVAIYAIDVEREGPSRIAVRLLEVNEDTVPAGVVPVSFGPAPDRGVPFPSVIVEVTPREFEEIQAGSLALPNRWRIGDLLAKRSSVAR